MRHFVMIHFGVAIVAAGGRDRHRRYLDHLYCASAGRLAGSCQLLDRSLLFNGKRVDRRVLAAKELNPSGGSCKKEILYSVRSTLYSTVLRRAPKDDLSTRDGGDTPVMSHLMR